MILIYMYTNTRYHIRNFKLLSIVRYQIFNRTTPVYMAIAFMMTTTLTYVAQGVLGGHSWGWEGKIANYLVKNTGGMQLSIPRCKPDPRAELNLLYNKLYDRS